MFGDKIGKAFKEDNGFLDSVKVIFSIYRYTGLSPMKVHEMVGQYKAAAVSFSSLYFASTVTCYTIFMAIQIFVSVQDTGRTWVINLYCFQRFFTTMFIHVRMVRDRHYILAVCNLLHSQPGSNIPRLWTHVVVMYFFIILLESLLTQVAWEHTDLMAIHGFIEEFLPGYYVGSMCLLFAVQVAGLDRGVKQFNDDFSILIKQSENKMDIRPFMARHILLRRLCLKLNQLYGPPMFLAMSMILLEISFCTFECIETLWDFEHNIFFIGSIIHAVPCVFALKMCQKVSNEDTLFISSRFFTVAKQLGLPGQCNEVREWKVQMKQLQLRFSTSQFFDLNCETLKMAASTIFTYTIILIQNIPHYEPSDD